MCHIRGELTFRNICPDCEGVGLWTGCSLWHQDTPLFLVKQLSSCDPFRAFVVVQHPRHPAYLVLARGVQLTLQDQTSKPSQLDNRLTPDECALFPSVVNSRVVLRYPRVLHPLVIHRADRVRDGTIEIHRLRYRIDLPEIRAMSTAR